MGGLMELLWNCIEERGYYEGGMVEGLEDGYFKKIDGMEFGVKQDEGKDGKGLGKGDIVLVGI